MRLWGLIKGRLADMDSQKINISIMIDENDSIDPQEERVFQDEKASG